MIMSTARICSIGCWILVLLFLLMSVVLLAFLRQQHYYLMRCSISCLTWFQDDSTRGWKTWVVVAGGCGGGGGPQADWTSDRLPRGPLIVDVNDTFYTNGQFKNEVIVIVVMMQLLICGLHIQRTALRIIYYISNMTSHFTAVQEAHHDSESKWTKYFSLVSFGYSLKQLLILMWFTCIYLVVVLLKLLRNEKLQASLNLSKQDNCLSSSYSDASHIPEGPTANWQSASGKVGES